jgi:hypothetical protein
MSEMLCNHVPIKYSVAVLKQLITTQAGMISIHMTYPSEVSAMMPTAQSQLVVL